jgi:hypothetical protein
MVTWMAFVRFAHEEEGKIEVPQGILRCHTSNAQRPCFSHENIGPGRSNMPEQRLERQLLWRLDFQDTFQGGSEFLQVCGFNLLTDCWRHPLKSLVELLQE